MPDSTRHTIQHDANSAQHDSNSAQGEATQILSSTSSRRQLLPKQFYNFQLWIWRWHARTPMQQSITMARAPSYRSLVNSWQGWTIFGNIWATEDTDYGVLSVIPEFLHRRPSKIFASGKNVTSEMLSVENELLVVNKRSITRYSWCKRRLF